jgi:hypothetical protein
MVATSKTFVLGAVCALAHAPAQICVMATTDTTQRSVEKCLEAHFMRALFAFFAAVQYTRSGQNLDPRR